MSVPEPTIGFVTSKAPKGGYRLCRVVSFADERVQIETVAYCTYLHEAQAIEHQEKAEMFGERAWYAPQPHIEQPRPMPTHSEEPFELPNAVRPGGGLMEQFAANGGLRAVAAFVFVWLTLLSVRLPA